MPSLLQYSEQLSSGTGLISIPQMQDVLKVLDAEVESAISNAFNILRTRIDRFGVVQPNITQLSTRGRILIELPGQDDPQRVRELLQGTANLEFWETYENGEVISYLIQANN